MSEIPLALVLVIVIGVLLIVLDRTGARDVTYGRKATWIVGAAFACGLAIYGLAYGEGDALLLALAVLVGTSYEHREWKRRRAVGRDGSAAELAG